MSQSLLSSKDIIDSGMSISLNQFVSDFAAGLMGVDAGRPVACNARTGVPFLPGIEPHSEASTVELIMAKLGQQSASRYPLISREICYPENPRRKCDLCLGVRPDSDWCIEIKMLRLMGDNGKPNDNMLMHILSPYPDHRSAVTDCEKLANTQLAGRKAIVIFAYEYAGYPAEPAARAFELLSSDRVFDWPRAASKLGNSALCGERPAYEERTGTAHGLA